MTDEFNLSKEHEAATDQPRPRPIRRAYSDMHGPAPPLVDAHPTRRESDKPDDSSRRPPPPPAAGGSSFFPFGTNDERPMSDDERLYYHPGSIRTSALQGAANAAGLINRDRLPVDGGFSDFGSDANSGARPGGKTDPHDPYAGAFDAAIGSRYGKKANAANDGRAADFGIGDAGTMESGRGPLSQAKVSKQFSQLMSQIDQGASIMPITSAVRREGVSGQLAHPLNHGFQSMSIDEAVRRGLAQAQEQDLVKTSLLGRVSLRFRQIKKFRPKYILADFDWGDRISTTHVMMSYGYGDWVVIAISFGLFAGLYYVQWEYDALSLYDEYLGFDFSRYRAATEKPILCAWTAFLVRMVVFHPTCVFVVWLTRLTRIVRGMPLGPP